MFDIIVSDPPYKMSDPLTMSKVKRGAASNYNGTLSFNELKNLPVNKITAENSLLALWCPSSIIPEGLEIMQAWGFTYKQNHIWVKIKKDPLQNLYKNIKNIISSPSYLVINNIIKSFNLNQILVCNMGRLFRQTHEIVLIGVKGNMYQYLENKAQRSVHLHSPLKHSSKPELLQDYLEIMFPKATKLEMFARRDRNNWICTGNDSNLDKPEDIKVFLERTIHEQENTSS
jgi:N6-adenosine-specific RNA methylase IME4